MSKVLKDEHWIFHWFPVYYSINTRITSKQSKHYTHCVQDLVEGKVGLRFYGISNVISVIGKWFFNSLNSAKVSSDGKTISETLTPRSPLILWCNISWVACYFFYEQMKKKSKWNINKYANIYKLNTSNKYLIIK